TENVAKSAPSGKAAGFGSAPGATPPGARPRPAARKDKPAGSSDAKVTFVKRDDQRGSVWAKDLGTDGFVVFNRGSAGVHDARLPSYIAECSSQAEHWIYPQFAEDKRALEDPDRGDRNGGVEWSYSDFSVSIRNRSTRTHKLALYCVDFERKKLKQRIEFLSGDKVLHAQEVADMGEGAWLHYEIAGSFEVKFTNTAEQEGGYAILSALMWDTAPDQKVARRSPPSGPVTAAPESLKPGLFAEYFDGVAYFPTVEDERTFFRVEQAVAFGTSPGGMRGWPFSGDCAAIYSGYLKIPEAGEYTFFLNSDDGANLYIDGKLLIKNDGQHAMQETWEKAELSAGLHRIWIEYFNSGATMGLEFTVKASGGERASPAALFFHDPAEAK
ncbi:MAG TPA: PA14 domain-containing protein, partial [Planctomycetota bacterium]|nr:PA14 domain-containing protein [Planctomycetota bacterium]